MNGIKIGTLSLKASSSYSIMVVGVGCVVESENGLFRTKSLLACGERLAKQQRLHGTCFV